MMKSGMASNRIWNPSFFLFLLSFPAIQLGAPSCSNGVPNRGTFLEARHRLVERRYAGTRWPFFGIRQSGLASWRIAPSPPIDHHLFSHVLPGKRGVRSHPLLLFFWEPL